MNTKNEPTNISHNDIIDEIQSLGKKVQEMLEANTTDIELKVNSLFSALADIAIFSPEQRNEIVIKGKSLERLIALTSLLHARNNDSFETLSTEDLKVGLDLLS